VIAPAIAISRDNINSFIHKDPGCAGRFYPSPAAILLQRLRAATGSLAASQRPEEAWGNP